MCKIVCQEMIPTCRDDTVEKLREVHPERSLNLNLENLPTPESLNDFWDGEEGRVLRNNFFSVTKVRQYIRNCQALGATDREREYCLLVLNSVTSTPPSFSARTCGGLLFAFLKKDGGLRPLLCGSIWHQQLYARLGPHMFHHHISKFYAMSRWTTG
jgi:hypothetical protein